MTHSITNPIEDTELIITERGTVYHLDLAPEHLAPIIITVGSQDRVKEVSKHFDSITHRAQHREFVTHTGSIGAREISVVSTGIGSGNIDIVFNEIDALVNIDFATRTVKAKKTQLSIIRLGTCGALQRDIAVDSMIVSTHGIGLDNLLLYYSPANNAEECYILNEFQRHTNLGGNNIHPYINEASIGLLRHFGTQYIHGITATCPGFYGPQGRSLRLKPAIPNLLDTLAAFSCKDTRIVNFEMETAAIYGMGKLLGHKCLSVSAALANRATKVFSKNPDLAIEKMIAHSLEIISGMQAL
jgi:uridine phosphorylase